MDTATSNVQMKLLENISSEFNDNVVMTFYIAFCSFIIMLLTSIGVIYGMFLFDTFSANTPIFFTLAMFSMLIYFIYFTFSGGYVLLLMASFIINLKVYEEGLDILVVPKRQLAFKNDKINTVNIIQKRSHFFKKILHDSSIFLEIIINKKKFLMALNNEDAEKLMRFSNNL